MNLASYKAGNNFKTFVFVAALTALLVGIGYLIGGATRPDRVRGDRGRLQLRHVLVQRVVGAQDEPAPSRSARSRSPSCTR